MQAALALGDEVLAQWRRARDGEPAPQAGWLDERRAELLQVFGQVGLAPADAEAALLALRRNLDQAVAPAAPSPQATMVLPVLADPREADSEPLTPMLDAQAGAEFDRITADYFKAMAIGTWLDFIDRDGNVQPGKLSWVSPISGRLMFVNRRGGRLCLSSAEELATMVWLDRLRLHRDNDAFYGAMQEVVDGLERPSAA